MLRVEDLGYSTRLRKPFLVDCMPMCSLELSSLTLMAPAAPVLCSLMSHLEIPRVYRVEEFTAY